MFSITLSVLECFHEKRAMCMHSSSHAVPPLSWKSLLLKITYSRSRRDLIFREYISQLLLIFSPFTKVLLKYWWWHFLPSSLLGKMKSGVTWYGPLLTNSILVLSAKTEGQSVGSIGSASVWMGAVNVSAPSPANSAQMDPS